MIKDNNGREWPSLSAAGKAYGFRLGGKCFRDLNKNGKVRIKDVVFYKDTQPEPKRVYIEDPLLEKLKARYSTRELELIAKGEGLEKNLIPFPKISLSGKHHRFVVISDTHIGSVYSPVEWHEIVSNFVNDPENGVEGVLHTGDLVEGMRVSRLGTQIYELSEVGYAKQRDKAVELLSKYHCPIYAISGNHDNFFKENFGCDIVDDISTKIPNLQYVGNNQADIEIDGCKIRLFHGGDGSSYALSYRLQKLVESYTGGQKPNILIAGHVHKFCYIFERNVHAISAPCMQSQTQWMQGKKLAAHTGFLVLDFDTTDGNVANLSLKLYPFYA